MRQAVLTSEVVPFSSFIAMVVSIIVMFGLVGCVSNQYFAKPVWQAGSHLLPPVSSASSNFSFIRLLAHWL